MPVMDQYDTAALVSMLIVGAHVVTVAGIWLYQRHRTRQNTAATPDGIPLHLYIFLSVY